LLSLPPCIAVPAFLCVHACMCVCVFFPHCKGWELLDGCFFTKVVTQCVATC
jgi:hypothetical protein